MGVLNLQQALRQPVQILWSPDVYESIPGVWAQATWKAAIHAIPVLNLDGMNLGRYQVQAWSCDVLS